jgi:glutamate synthase (NADPH/NADH) large chain/glutamate synthase (ferredoxin)
VDTTHWGYKDPFPERKTLYDPSFEHDSCGVGFIADVSGHRSHSILKKAVEAVSNLTHRGALDADAKTGDGAGVLTQIPEKLFKREAAKLGHRVESISDLAVGVLFMPREEEKRARAMAIVEGALSYYRLPFFGWRKTPIDDSVLGDKAASTMPDIGQILIGRPEGLPHDEFERTLYLARKEMEEAAHNKNIDLYLPSISHRTIVYKGLFVAHELSSFYRDLRDPDYTTALAVFHQRYSTNTFPTWPLAQPFRFLAHNGEINTLRGNRNWTAAREVEFRSEVWGERIEKLKPVIQPGGSDSASLDNVFELLILSGRDILHSMMMLVPEAYQRMPLMDPAIRGFYEYHSCLCEPWDGPAALAFSDGRYVGATLDRNGLRPARYKVAEDGLVVMASEVGVIEMDDSKVVEKGRLGPGKMIAVDTVGKRFLRDSDIKGEISRRRPYADWVKRQMVRPDVKRINSNGARPPVDKASLVRRQKIFGYVNEDVDLILKPMAMEGKEPVGSMGDDTPLAVLSYKPRVLYTYFKQLFAQVTNPPIDHLREELVMSLNSALGYRRSLLSETEEHARLVKFPSPILTDAELKWLKALEIPGFAPATLSALFPAAQRHEGLRKALDGLCRASEEAIDRGSSIIILTDRRADAGSAPIPMLLAVGAVHQHLIRRGRRMKASIVAEAGDSREVHHFAALLGYGANAVNPYLAMQTVCSLAEEGELGVLDHQTALDNYKKALDAGILKIMSKMGISTLSSYRGAQVFEALGLASPLVDECFTGTPSRLGGVGLKEIAEDVLRFHRTAFDDGKNKNLEDGGYYKYKFTGEAHAFNPPMIKEIHRALREGDRKHYEAYASIVEGRKPLTLRDLIEFKPGNPIPIEEVEPAESIMRRFVSSAMSHGALSREAHETIAIAMNRIGAKSNSGEGGEDPARYRRRPNGDWANSAVKQVASARFGVTPEYLISAKELQIKMAQGSKPGEGGQLPGKKVTAEIAFIRHSIPGVTLISPPPHHDIYSIEDLSQLIYDLKQVNPRAKVSVKLVAEAGVGTIAAGVAKAYADIILISGHDGGTGASPWSSIKNAGIPGELGLAETQQILVLNDLRGRVILQTDGGLKTGRDVVVSAMLGAEQFGFGTAAVVATGCIMARRCHLNNCPVGVATQDKKLRAKFTGTPEMVINFFAFVAEEVREILASLGFRKLDDVIGRVDLLKQRSDVAYPKGASLDLDAILADVDPEGVRPRMHTKERNDRADAPLDDTILQDAKDAIATNTSIVLSYDVKNTHRAIGAKLAGEIAYHYGDEGLDGIVECHFRGSAGGSFGAFSIRGLRFILTGEANDYVGKGMAGGEIVVKPPPEAKFPSRLNSIMGNTVMYGATGGSLYAAGCAGERFAVRNSGGRAVVEGVGDHGCEYMTGGVVVILGETGRNFGAGMTGGIAYVLDEKRDFPSKYNPQLVRLVEKLTPEDEKTLVSMIGRHHELTASLRSKEITDRWGYYSGLFWKVEPYPPEKEAKLTEEEDAAVGEAAVKEPAVGKPAARS